MTPVPSIAVAITAVQKTVDSHDWRFELSARGGNLPDHFDGECSCGAELYYVHQDELQTATVLAHGEPVPGLSEKLRFRWYMVQLGYLTGVYRLLRWINRIFGINRKDGRNG